MDCFLTQHNCDRCNAHLSVRIMSWFTDETICMTCSAEERKIKRSLPDYGKSLEGCGYIPEML